MIKIYFKLTIKKYKHIISKLLQYLGIVELSSSIANLFFPEFIKNLSLNSTHFLILFILLLLFSIITNIPKLKRTFIIKNRDINVSIIVGDIFKQKGSMIIPTNTTFDTYMENEFISSNSIQGQFQELYFKNNLNLLDNMLENSLKDTKIKENLYDDRKTKIKRYECGTVTEINYNNNFFYFLALADVSKNGTPKAQYENIIIALQGLWTYLSEHKHINDLIIPIIGTGRAGIAEATKMQVIKDIIFSFVTISNETKITDNLIICINPNDLKNNIVDIEEIFEYVSYTSKYRYEHVDYKKNGKPLN